MGEFGGTELAAETGLDGRLDGTAMGRETAIVGEFGGEKEPHVTAGDGNPVCTLSRWSSIRSIRNPFHVIWYGVASTPEVSDGLCGYSQGLESGVNTGSWDMFADEEA